MGLVLSCATVVVLATVLAVPMITGIWAVRALCRAIPGGYATLRRGGMNRRTARACARVIAETD